MAFKTYDLGDQYRWMLGLSTDSYPVLGLQDAKTRAMETDTGHVAEWTGAKWQHISAGGAIDVHTAHVHNKPVNTYVHRHLGAETTLAVAAAPDDIQVTVADSTGFAAGHNLHIGNGTRESTEPEIILVTGNVLSLDRPLDGDWPIGTPVANSEEKLSTLVGSMVAPIIYKATPDHSETWHIQSLVLSMIMSSAADDSLFGNLPALANGVVIRGTDGASGRHRTITNWKTNRDIKLDMLDVVYSDKAGPGVFSVTGDGALFQRTGAVPSLSGTNEDRLEVLIQDNLTGLVDFKIKAQGHVEDK